MIEYAHQAFISVYVCKLLHHYGKLGNFPCGWVVDEDSWWMITYEALMCSCGKVWIEELDMAMKYYFSDPAMMEYYRLCRKYSRCFGVSIKENPFVVKAEQYVRRMLELPASNYGWTLQIKINHDWASGIVFCVDDCFDGYLQLLEALLEIFSFYETELTVLKGALAEKEEIIKEAA